MPSPTELNELLRSSLSMTAKCHFWHLATQKYEHHLVFGDLYGLFHDFTDRFIEVMRGAKDFKPSPGKFGVEFTNPANAPGELEDYVKSLDAVRDNTLPWWNAIVDETQESMYKQLYKLKHLS